MTTYQPTPEEKLRKDDCEDCSERAVTDGLYREHCSGEEAPEDSE